MQDHGDLQPLYFQQENVTFQYASKGHLTSKIQIRNPNNSPIFYKFKLSRPKYYLLKPDRGFIQPRSTTVVDVSLHQDGVELAIHDKVKCFYKFVEQTNHEPQRGFQSYESTSTIRMHVLINDLPQKFQNQQYVRSSQVRSMSGSKHTFNFNNGANSKLSTLDGMVKDKQFKIESLNSEIDLLKGSKKPKTNQNSMTKWLLIAGGGLIVGLLSSFWV